MLNPLVKRELTEKIVEQIRNPGGMNVLVRPTDSLKFAQPFNDLSNSKAVLSTAYLH